MKKSNGSPWRIPSESALKLKLMLEELDEMKIVFAAKQAEATIYLRKLLREAKAPMSANVDPETGIITVPPKS